MTSRERVQAVCAGEKPDRLPFNFWMDRDRMHQMDAQFGENFRVSHYGADVIETFAHLPFFEEAREKEERFFDGTTSWLTKCGAAGVRALWDMPMPDSREHSYYEGIRADRRRWPDKALFAMLTSPLDILFDRLGLEQLSYDLSDYPDETETLCNRLAQALLVALEQILNCEVDVLYLAGDICTSRGPMFSNEMLRRFCFLPMRPLIDYAHSRGVKVFYHTDGYVMDILPLLIAYGIDGVNPLQFSVGNDPQRFIRDFGGKLLVYGGIDNCFIIPNGTVREVRSHIRFLFETLGKHSGYIASSHDIPRHAPQANMDAMVDEIRRCVY